MHLTVKIPILEDKLSPKKRQQLDQLTARDSMVIREYLRIIEKEAPQLWRSGQEGRRIAVSKLDQLTLTSKALKRTQKDGSVKKTLGRPCVKYDLKQLFRGRITARELKECRDTAIAMWHSHCERVQDHTLIYWKIMAKSKYENHETDLARVLEWWETEKKPTPPCQAETNRSQKLPRHANMRTTAFLHKRPTKLTNYWLEVYYPEQRKHLWLPLNPALYHLSILKEGKAKTTQLVKHKNKRWYAHVAVSIPISKQQNETKPPALISTDLGIKKAAVAVLLTGDKKSGLKAEDIQFFEQETKIRKINEVDNQIASLQRQKASFQKIGKETKNVTRKLTHLRQKRKELAIQYDHEVTAQICDWVELLQHTYRVYVVVGELKGIRHSRRKGDGKSRHHRRELHRWAFARFTTFLQYKLELSGLPPSRFRTIRESWTSKTCSKCGSRKTHRPFQALIICLECGAHIQADINGAMNIAFKLIKSFTKEPALDHWLIKPLRASASPPTSVTAVGAISTSSSGNDTSSTVSRSRGTRNPVKKISGTT